jgi:CRISPR-associated protein Cmr3
MNTNRIGLFLEPLDVLFFRDGRPYEPGTRGQSGLPMPQTLAGAISTALLEQRGTDFDRLGRAVRDGGTFADALDVVGQPRWLAQVAVRGPWIAFGQGAVTPQDVLVPVPAILLQFKNEKPSAVRRLHPLPTGRLPGWEPPLPQMRPLWSSEVQPIQAAAGFLGIAGLRAFLGGEDVSPDQLVPAAELFEFDHRTGIGISPDRFVAEEGLIYAASFLTLKPHAGFYAEAVLPEGIGVEEFTRLPTITFGGESRRVCLHILEQPWEWPEFVPNGDRRRPFVTLTTPGLFAHRWYPQVIAQHLVAAAVPGDVAVSGWDLARGGPKPTRFAAKAGSTYFLNESLANWPTALSDDKFDQQQGWGCYLKGVWTDE